jgi:hypothetical protein
MKRRQLRNAARLWQAEQLRLLKKKPFEVLAKLPRRSRLQSPPYLARLKFCIMRSPGNNGGVDISVCECVRFLLIFEASAGPSFEKLQDGRVIHEVTECAPGA